MLAPLVLGLLPRLRVPQVVLLLAGGMAIGPQGLAVAAPELVRPPADVGLGSVFLLAGYEIDQRLARRDAGRCALVAWLVTVAPAVGIVGGLAALGIVHAFVPVAIALTTTAFARCCRCCATPRCSARTSPPLRADPPRRPGGHRGRPLGSSG